MSRLMRVFLHVGPASLSVCSSPILLSCLLRSITSQLWQKQRQETSAIPRLQTCLKARVQTPATCLPCPSVSFARPKTLPESPRTPSTSRYFATRTSLRPLSAEMVPRSRQYTKDRQTRALHGRTLAPARKHISKLINNLPHGSLLSSRLSLLKT